MNEREMAALRAYYPSVVFYSRSISFHDGCRDGLREALSTAMEDVGGKRSAECSWQIVPILNHRFLKEAHKTGGKISCWSIRPLQ